MADFTILPNAAVGVGGLPSGTTVTALRDNPIAIAEGAIGAPRVWGSARNHNKLGEITATADVTELALTGLPAHNDVIIMCEGFKRGIDGLQLTAKLDISDDNGVSWSTIAQLALQSGNGRAMMMLFTGWGENRSFRVGTNFSQSPTFEGALLSFPGKINAVRMSRISGGTIAAGAKIEVWALAEGYLS